jgi:cobalt-zinc-cadmium efflux system membrane fusion protein
VSQTAANSATILVVDDDAAVRQVLGRVLSREGHRVVEAADPAGALRLADENTPQVAVVDLCLTDGDGAALAGQLQDRRAGLPLILITGYPLRLHENPALSRPFRQVLTKPVDVNALRLAVNAALTEAAMPTPKATPMTDPTTVPVPDNGRRPSHAEPGAAHPHHTWGERIKSTGVVILALAVLGAFLAYVMGVPIPGLGGRESEPTVQQAAPPKIELLPGSPHTVSVPADVRESLGMRRAGADRLATAEAPTAARPLVMSGSTGLDPTGLMRLRARFAPAQVVQLGQVEEQDEQGRTIARDLRSGDRVGKADLLGVYYSADVGNKKNDLVDALSQLKLDQELLDASQRAYDKGSIPLLDLIAAKRAVEGDYNAIDRAENTLRAWTVPEDDIDAVRKEAAELIKQGNERDRSPEARKEQLRRWARVELRAPGDGVIVERNGNPTETIVDNTINLFQIARVDRLLVVGNAPEDELPTLQGLKGARRKWTVRTIGAPPAGIVAPIDDISYIIDVSQHSAVVKGYIPNPAGAMRSGQYVTASVELPPPEDAVAIPAGALADDGKQAVVFVQIGDQPGVYQMRRVEVVQRLDKTILVKSRFAEGKGEQPLTPEEREAGLLPRRVLTPGERVITAGVLELKKELEDRESAADSPAPR